MKTQWSDVIDGAQDLILWFGWAGQPSSETDKQWIEGPKKKKKKTKTKNQP
jgi:hypothetical protein